MKNIGGGTLVCVAPKTFHSYLGEAFAQAGIKIRFRQRPVSKPFGSDPYALEKISSQYLGQVDGLLLIGPSLASPSNIIPAPVLQGLPVGVMCADRPQDLLAWTSALHQGASSYHCCAVLSMWHPQYVPVAQRFVRTMVPRYPRRVRRWFADRVDRETLCGRLAKGPRMVVYIGHGDNHGWGGYRGVQWRHIIEQPSHQPCHVVLSFACNTVKSKANTVAFGSRWVLGGRTMAYVGSGQSVYSDMNATLVSETAGVLSSKSVHHIGALLTQLDHRVRTLSSLKSVEKVFRTYRLLGNPLAPLL